MFKGDGTMDSLLEAAQTYSQESFLQIVIDGVPEAIMVIDHQYRIVLVNRAVRELAAAGVDLTEPQFCYQLSHKLNAPCDGDAHPWSLALVQASG